MLGTSMEPALDVLHRALQGEEGARSFLDRTSSIYVLDATDVTQPKTYGCWNFIHQAINEIERAEQKQQQANHHNNNTTTTTTPGVVQQRQQQQQLFAHVQLLANMALRVARRSNALDKQLVATCIENAQKYHGSAKEAQTMMELNIEIRDIVMGRIAALALDPSFHPHNNHPLQSNHHTNNQNHHNNNHQHSSAFSDAVVMETFCAVLAANAVSNGPSAVNHLVSEWIVPSAANLPPFCLACVTLHLALEASRKTAPIHTQDMLQRLSNSVMARVLAPVLVETITENNTTTTTTTTEENTSPLSSTTNGNGGLSRHEHNSRIAALSLRAMDQWCAVTDLSLAQIRHICSKVQINIVDLLSDAMYSDSGWVVDALAGLIEAVVERHQVPTVSEERMTQVRYIMQVDEASFRSNISAVQLLSIESKEMASILEELVSAIGLQRFRFVDRQNNGDHDVCRSLTRIAASVSLACSNLPPEGRQIKSGPGLLDLLMKSASHPSVNICGIAIDVLAKLMAVGSDDGDDDENHNLKNHQQQQHQNNNPSLGGLSNQLLPILQRRAITPHHFDARNNGRVSLVASDICGVNVHEFEIFRDTSLNDALVECFKSNAESYMASCTAAIEEFCTGSNASVQVSFHLEAALFCLGAVADDVLMMAAATAAAPQQNNNNGSHHHHHHAAASAYLVRCTAALAGKSQSLTSNPMTLVQACRFVQKYDKWYCSNQVDGALDVAADLSLSTFSLCATSFPQAAVSIEMKREADTSPYTAAANTLQALLCLSPQHFLSNHAIAALGAGWEASYAAANQHGILSIDDRKAICIGICHVLASLPGDQRDKSLLALAMPSLDCLETMTEHANQAAAAANYSDGRSHQQLDAILDRISAEIIIVTTMARAFTDACSINDSSMESGCRTSDGHAAIVEPALALVKRAWPSVARAASCYNYHDSISDALGFFLTKCLPPECNDELSVSFAKELCLVATSIVVQSDTTASSEKELNFQPVVDFLQSFVKIHGDVIDKDARSSLQGQSSNSSAPSNTAGREIGKCLENLLLTTIVAIHNLLGTTWTSAQRQGQGQPPFESKAEPVEDRRQTSHRALSAVFSLLRTCAERCPVFLLHLPAARGLDRHEDLLVRRAVESAVACLLETDEATSKGAMEFLESTVLLTQSSAEDVCHIAEEILSRVRANIVSALLMGACGKLNASTLEDAAGLLQRLLPSASEDMVLQALSNEHFMLGSRGRNVALGVFAKCSRKELSDDQISEFLQSMWELHQVERPEPLHESDSVSRFCKKYSV